MGLTEPIPVQKQERLQVVDILRGFALFGILMVNIQVAGQTPMDLWSPGGVDTAAFFVMKAFFSTKFYPLYSFLFGLGMSLQMLRLENRGAPFLGMYLRRLLWLFVIGGLHAVLIWEGDILTVYALLGLLLVLCRKLKPRTLAVIALALILIQMFALGPFSDWFSAHSDSSRVEMEWYQLGHFIRTGTFLEQVGYRFEHWYPVNLALEVATQGSFGMGAAVFGLFLLTLANICGYFLLGLAAGKSGLFQDVEGHLRSWRRAFWITFPVGLALNIGCTLWFDDLRARMIEASVPGWETYLQGALSGLMPVLTIGYISGLVLLSRKARLLRFLAPAGQMALTNYLAQNLTFTWLFFGYGFGLYGKIPGGWVILIAVALYGLQLVASRFWMQWFRFGPMEWVWRTLTYWRRQPMRQIEELEPPPLPQKK